MLVVRTKRDKCGRNVFKRTEKRREKKSKENDSSERKRKISIWKERKKEGKKGRKKGSGRENEERK